MRVRAIAATIGVSLLLTFLPGSGANAQRIDILATQKRYFDFYKQGNFAAALIEARKLEQAVRQRGGTGHENYPIVLEFVGNSLAGTGKYAEADQAYERVLEIRREMYGDSSTKVADAYNNLGNNKLRQAQYPQAEEYYVRAAGIYQEAKGMNSPDFAFVVSNLGVAYENIGKYKEAETVRKHVLSVYEKAYGADDSRVADAVSKLGSFYQAFGRYTEADALFKRAYAIQSRQDDPLPAARTLNNMAILQIDLGRFSEAEAQFRKAVEIEERTLGPNHPVVAEALQNLAAALKAQCRYDDAESLARRVIAIREKTLGPRHPDVASTLVNLGNVLVVNERYADADPLYKRALSIQEETLGKDHAKVAFTLHNLGYAAEAQKRYAEAEEFGRRAIAIREASLGKDHIDIAITLNSLGNTLLAQKKYPEAEAAFTRALSIYQKSVGAEHPSAALTAFNISRLEAARGNTKAALDWSRKAVNALLAAANTASGDEAGSQGCLVQQRSSMFSGRVALLAAAAKANLEPKPALTNEAFEMAQWANQSGAAQALQQMGARFAAGSDALGALVRESQDLTARAKERDKALISMMSRPQTQQGSDAIAQMRADAAELQRKIAAANARLEKEFPNYAALASPKPMSVKDAQALLGPDEALIVWVAGEDTTDMFAITREAVDWRTLAFGSEALSKKVADFRKGLDVELVASGTPEKDKLFDLKLAHQFYKELFGPIEPLLKSKHNLLLVASGALTALPFHVLVTEPPVVTGSDDMSDYRSAAWLARRNAITVVPSVASLKSLRIFASKDVAGKPMVGFGDPVFQPGAASPNASPDGGQRSAKQNPKKNAKQNPKANNATPQRAVAKTRSYVDFWKGASVDPARLGDALGQLPDTADEIRDVAKKLGAGNDDIFLGTAASETAVKAAHLDNYKVVYFATHGLVAGDVKGLAEPSLVLTLPKIPTPQDDGLLTASEVAQLHLNADWVVLSACNTIAGEKPGAEALSGLARSFFYAGARALLVSHWAVASDAATTLTTATFANLMADPKLGRAEALRRSMIAYIADTSRPVNAYPAFWAPFAIVGEGVLR